MIPNFAFLEETILHPEESLFAALYESGGTGHYQLHLRPLRRRRRYEPSNQRTLDLSLEGDSPTNYYRRRKVTPVAMPMYADDDFVLSGLTSRFRDHVL